MPFSLQTQDEVNGRKADDTAVVKNITKELNGGAEEKIVNVTRLGTLDRTGSKRRPIRLVFSDIATARVILRSGKNLPEGLKVNNDLTPAQQEHLNNLRKELDVRRIKYPNAAIKYVRSQPRIVNGETSGNAKRQQPRRE